MKDYITGIKPIYTKNTITIFSKEKQSNSRKLQSKMAPNQNVKKFLLSEPLLTEYQVSRNSKYDKKISTNQINRKAKRKFVIERTIDLHGLTKTEAFEATLKFFINCQSKNIRRVLVITGGSNQRNSVIRLSFSKWIDEYFQKYISMYTSAKSLHGGEGAFYVTLRTHLIEEKNFI